MLHAVLEKISLEIETVIACHMPSNEIDIRDSSHHLDDDTCKLWPKTAQPLRSTASVPVGSHSSAKRVSHVKEKECKV